MSSEDALLADIRGSSSYGVMPVRVDLYRNWTEVPGSNAITDQLDAMEAEHPGVRCVQTSDAGCYVGHTPRSRWLTH